MLVIMVDGCTVTGGMLGGCAVVRLGGFAAGQDVQSEKGAMLQEVTEG